MRQRLRHPDSRRHQLPSLPSQQPEARQAAPPSPSLETFSGRRKNDETHNLVRSADRLRGSVSGRYSHSPLKRQLPDYKEIEARFDWAIRVHFGLPESPSPAVKEADNILLVTEVRDLFPAGRVLHKVPVAAKPMNGRIWPLAPETAKDQFMDRFHFLQR